MNPYAVAVRYPGPPTAVIESEGAAAVASAQRVRATDRADILGLARRGPELDWSAIRHRLAPLAAAKDEPDIMASVARLEAEFGR